MANVVKYKIVGDLNAKGSVLFDAINPADVPIPASGKFALFNDSTNSNKLSTKDFAGTVAEVGSGSGGADWFMSWSAANFPQDWNEATWTNVGANRPAPDYDSFKFPVFAVDYAVAEGLGLFMIDEIPTGATNLVVNIPAAPSDGAATGDNMGWKMDITVNEGAISTVTLGATAMSGTTDEFITGSYTVALSGLSAVAGDMITCLIYPDTAVTTPKQCDWQVKYVRFEVS